MMSPLGITDTGKFRRGARMPAFLALEEDATWAPIVEAPAIFLFLDFDGTLIETAPRPQDVYLSARRKQTLQALLDAPKVSVAIVSGRQVDDLKRLIGLDALFYVGSHGLEWSAPDGTIERCPIGAPVADAMASLREQFHTRAPDQRGVFLEDKDTAVALHYRMAAEDTALAAKSDFLRAVHHYQQRGIPLEIVAGKEVVEAKPAAQNKGDAAIRLLEHYGDGALPIYCGDDFTDEVAFHRLDKKGITILVAETPRPTAATYYLRNPNEMHEFLRLLARVSGTAR
jgi:trehalose 6-phosphate phosphatase